MRVIIAMPGKLAEEREKRIRRRESIAISKRHKRIKVLKQIGRTIR